MILLPATLYYKDVVVGEESIGLEVLESDQKSVTQEPDDVLLVVYSITGQGERKINECFLLRFITS